MKLLWCIVIERWAFKDSEVKNWIISLSNVLPWQPTKKQYWIDYCPKPIRGVPYDSSHTIILVSNNNDHLIIGNEKPLYCILFQIF